MNQTSGSVRMLQATNNCGGYDPRSKESALNEFGRMHLGHPSSSYSFQNQNFIPDMASEKEKRLARVFDCGASAAMLLDQEQSPNPTAAADDANTNIYTEPTIIDLNSNCFATNNDDFLVDGQTLSQQRRPESLTITGQDLAITLRQGQMTQTLLNPQHQQQVVSVPAQAPSQHLDSHHQQLLYYYSTNRMEFLPLCDLLFNIISLAAYFCDVVFDLVTVYTLYLNRQFSWSFVSLCVILVSAIISQILSYRWCRRDQKNERVALQKHLEQQQQSDPNQRRYRLESDQTCPESRILIVIHVLFCGVLWRYFKLFAPVNLATVKREVSELCILRMIHAFCQAGPMLLLQTYLVWRKPSLDMITDLNIISIFLSLFSICWALSSFNKNIRPEKIHKLVLTWFGVIFQFLWRIGTITSRVVALTIYAVLYEQWLFAVLFLHWFSMFLWLLSPQMLQLEQMDQNQPEEKKDAKRKRILSAAGLAWIYIFCFVNMEDTNSRFRMLAFYSTMFLENILLMSISIFFDNRLSIPWYRSLAIFLVIGSFLVGMFFMWIYYRYFHIRNLKNSLFNAGPSCHNGVEQQHHQQLCATGNNQISAKEKSILNQLLLNQGNSVENKNIDPKLLPFAENMFNGQYFFQQNPGVVPTAASGREEIPGVFNCRLNPALKRKKKKPSTIPPLPHLISPEVKLGFKNALEAISENGNANPGTMQNGLTFRTGYPVKNHVYQIQRPLTNASMLMRSYRQSSADTFWRKSNLSARSLSISPTTMLNAKHPFSSTITTPTSPNMLLPTRNFTDKLDFILDQSSQIHNHHLTEANKKKIIRPKPIVQHSINLDSISEINMDLEKSPDFYDNLEEHYAKNGDTEAAYNYYEYLTARRLKKEAGLNQDPTVDSENALFLHQRPPVPGRESGGGKSQENDHSSYVEGKKSLVGSGRKKPNQKPKMQDFAVDGQNRRTAKKKPYRKSKSNGQMKCTHKSYRSRTMDSSHSSITSSKPEDDYSSSGEDGDIESDVNHHRLSPEEFNKSLKHRTKAIMVASSLYDEMGYGKHNSADHQFKINKATDLENPYGQIANPNLEQQGTAISTGLHTIDQPCRPRTAIQYNGAKYKRYNTPL